MGPGVLKEAILYNISKRYGTTCRSISGRTLGHRLKTRNFGTSSSTLVSRTTSTKLTKRISISRLSQIDKTTGRIRCNYLSSNHQVQSVSVQTRGPEIPLTQVEASKSSMKRALQLWETRTAEKILKS